MGIRDKFKFDLSKTEDKLKLFILVSGTLIFFVVAAFAGLELTSTPEFCSLCHNAMQPDYVTWQASSHSQIACVKCHMDSNLFNKVIAKIKSVTHLVDYVSGSYKEHLPITMISEMPDSRCLYCHSVQNRDFTLTGDLIVPHELHGEKGVQCIECHRGVAHGNINARNVAVGDLGAWTLEDGKKNMAKQFTQPDMDTCVECHMTPSKYGLQDQKPVTFRCEACHSAIDTPNDHADPKWTPEGVHGLSAQNDANYFKECIKCHDIGVKTKEISTGDKVRDYAWGNDFCISCHAKLPASHANRDQWMPQHKERVKTKGMKNCEACHSLKAPEGDLKAPAALYCNKCHWF